MSKPVWYPSISTDALLRALIAHSGMTDYALAKAAGVDATQIGRFKRAERSITTETADKLFRALGYVWPPREVDVMTDAERADAANVGANAEYAKAIEDVRAEAIKSGGMEKIIAVAQGKKGARAKPTGEGKKPKK